MYSLPHFNKDYFEKTFDEKYGSGFAWLIKSLSLWNKNTNP